jgi:hypothetical protein
MKNMILLMPMATFFLFACSKKNSTVIGKYVNTFEPDADHYVELKADSTFIHYYKKNNEVKENKGVWRLSIDPEQTQIIFDTWVDFGYKDLPICDHCLRMVQLKDEELMFNVDLPNEVNFKKSD